MKKYKFKLEGLLKLREFKEHKVKVELGQINRKIQEAKERIVFLKNDIAKSFDSQNRVVQEGIDARGLGFYSYYYQIKLDHIEALENILFSLGKKYQEKLQEMNKVHAEYKLIKNIKKKDYDEFHKERVKQIDMENEEIVQLRSQHLKRRGEK